jgi:hypothetical protein
MEAMVLAGLVSSALATAYLAWRRHYRGLRLLLAATGWVLFFIGLAAAFQVMPYGPQLFLVGCVTGVVIQLASNGAPRQADSEGEVTRSSVG